MSWDETIYQCPADGSLLEPEESSSGPRLRCRQGHGFAIRQGVPDFTWPPELETLDHETRDYYEESASTYDRYVHLTYKTYGEDEDAVLDALIDRLHLAPHHVVLEVGCGTGRSSVRIAKRLGTDGTMYLQELSPRCLALAVEKLRDCPVPHEFAVANGCYLPLPDNSVEAAYHYGGLNVFSDIGRALDEMARVTKPGGRVVVSDESMPVWLRETEFAKIMMNSNPLLRYEVPLQHLPVCARDVKVEWILGGVFYVIEFTVGEGEPTANLDFEIPTPRGGTHRTRYYGNLEGVTPEAKGLAHKARNKTGKSMFRWLDDVVREAARRDLDSDATGE